MRLFIIGGKANAGKNELAKMIKEYYDKKDEKSIITEYSKYVKLVADEMINWEGRESKPRSLLQSLGEEYRKVCGPSIFVDRMREDISIFQRYYQNIIICDARLIPELTLMKTKYSKCYTIHLLNKRESVLTEAEQHHVTETEFDHYKDFDFTLENIDEEQMKKDIFKILEGLDE